MVSLMLLALIAGATEDDKARAAVAVAVARASLVTATPKPPVRYVLAEPAKPAAPARTVTVYKFSLKTCPPCRAFAPIFADWRARLASRLVRFADVDGEDDPATARRYGVTSYPAVVVCDGRTHYRFDGAPSEEQIRETMRRLGVVVAPAPASPPVATGTAGSSHLHRCEVCGTVFGHGPSGRENLDHRCPNPKCKRGPWDVWYTGQ